MSLFRKLFGQTLLLRRIFADFLVSDFDFRSHQRVGGLDPIFVDLIYRQAAPAPLPASNPLSVL
jgi:hypothetical protein